MCYWWQWWRSPSGFRCHWLGCCPTLEPMVPTSQRAEQQHLRRSCVRHALGWMWQLKGQIAFALVRYGTVGRKDQRLYLLGGQPFSPQNGLRLQTCEQKDILLTTDIESLLYASVNPTTGGWESMVRCDAALSLPSKGQQGSRVSSPGFLQGASELGERDGRSAPLLFMMQPYISKFDLLGASKIRNGCEGSC